MSSTPSRSTRYSLLLQTLAGALIEKSGGDLRIGMEFVKLLAPQTSEKESVAPTVPEPPVVNEICFVPAPEVIAPFIIDHAKVASGSPL